MSILGELWYGNIFPNEQSASRESYIASQKVATEKDRLFSMLSSEQREVTEKLLTAQIEQVSILERDAFICGYRLATKLFLDSLKK